MICRYVQDKWPIRNTVVIVKNIITYLDSNLQDTTPITHMIHPRQLASICARTPSPACFHAPSPACFHAPSPACCHAPSPACFHGRARPLLTSLLLCPLASLLPCARAPPSQACFHAPLPASFLRAHMPASFHALTRQPARVKSSLCRCPSRHLS